VAVTGELHLRVAGLKPELVHVMPSVIHTHPVALSHYCHKVACLGMHAEKLAFVARQELLRGPLFYVLIMTAVTVVFWRESPVGMMVLSLMCGGDGLADIICRKFGNANLPFNTSKSWAGSAAMFAGKLHLELRGPLAC